MVFFFQFEVNEALLATRVPSEFSRRPRELDFPNLKAEEYRNLLIFYFPAILHRLAPSLAEQTLGQAAMAQRMSGVSLPSSSTCYEHYSPCRGVHLSSQNKSSSSRKGSTNITRYIHLILLDS
jgi:hypothetical protein